MTFPAAGAEGGGQVTGDGVQPGGGSSTGGQGDSGQQANGQKTGTNPAWAEYLKDIPAGLHGAVTPAFQKWDQAMNAKLSQVQQQYAPWQDIIGGGAQPEQVSGALELIQMLKQDPAAAIGELAQWAASMGTDLSGIGFGDQGGVGGQGDGEQQGLSDEDGEQLPDWAQQLISGSKDQQELLDLVAQKIIADGQAAEEEQAVDELEAQLTPLLTQAGIQFQGENADADALDVIFSAMSNGATPEQAVGRWTALQQRVRGQANSANAPRVLGSGGGLPTQQVDPNTPLSQKDRRALAVQRAREMMGQGG